MKAKIVRLYHMAQRRLFLDTDEHDRIAEEVSLYRILKLRKRQEARIVYKVHDSHDNSQTASTAIIRKTMEFMRMKYDYIQVDKESARSIANNLNKKLPQAANNVSETPITIDELHLAVKKGKPLKAPGSDWIRQEFFKVTSETTKHKVAILNQMHTERGYNGSTETWNNNIPAQDAYT